MPALYRHPDRIVVQFKSQKCTIACTMKTFAQLLTEYTRRTGVTDAELARHLGVRRQTIFRWKEGLTKRPRERQDVQRLADKLRLSPAERDELLLAAGFAPETPAPPQPHSSVGDEHLQPPPEVAAPARKWRPWHWGLAAALILLALAGLLIMEMRRPADVRYSASIAMGPTAAPNETLILAAQFANYGGEKLGYNVAGRLAEVLRTQLDDAGMSQTRVQVIPEIIDSQEQALQLGRGQGARLIIWGEYDSGRVLAHVTPLVPEASTRDALHLLTDAADLNAVINTDLPDEVRWLALAALGQIAYLSGDYDHAQQAFQQALQQHPSQLDGLDVVYFYLALLAQRQPQPDQNQIIAYYSQAIDLSPGFVSALNNRSAAYLARNAPGDLERAIADLRRVVALLPEEPGGHYNLGLALSRQGPDALPQALDSLKKAYALAPDAAGVNNALCWTYALARQPQAALPYCDKAVTLDASGASHDSRGIVRAEMGDYENAIADFQYFLQHYQEANPQAYARYAPLRRAWIKSLQQGKNPFDAATLARLAGD